MFKQIEIKNFRGIKELKVENLKKFNVFVGDNGSGKTSILDAVYISINPNNPDLPRRTNEFRKIDEISERSWKALFNNFDSDNNISINSLLTENKKRNIQIEAMFEFQKEEYLKSLGKVSKTSSDSKMKKNIIGLNIKFDVNGKKYESGINQQEQRMPDGVSLFRLLPRADEKYNELLTGTYANSSTIRDQSNMVEALNNVLNLKKESEVVEFLRNFKESVSGIQFDNNKKINIIDDDFDERVLLNTYGDGLVRGLNYYLAALNNNNIILIDEIENGLHWSKQMVVFEYLYKISEEFKDVQFFMTSHSYDVVKSLYETAEEFDFMSDVNICRVESANGRSRIEYFNGDDLKYFSENKLELR